MAFKLLLNYFAILHTMQNYMLQFLGMLDVLSMLISPSSFP